MNINDFLVKSGLTPQSVNIREIAEFKMDEMNSSLEKKESSLEMIDSLCHTVNDIRINRSVIAIDAGGTNLRTALIKFSENGEYVIEKSEKVKMPGLYEEVTKDEFYSVFADLVEPYINLSDYIGWCFSYSAQILPNHDAKVLSVSKELKAESIIGSELGKSLLSELSRRGYDVSEKKVMVFNDSVTTLLAGISKIEELNCSGCIGLILGTGTNSSFVKDGTVINEESGGLDIYGSQIDLDFFNSTRIPSYHHLEKLISGAYLGLLSSFYIREAIGNSVFSEGFSKKFNEINNVSTIDISDFLLNKPSALDVCIETQEDSDNLTVLLKAHISRAAKFCAANLAGTILNSDYDTSKPVLISVDGTTFINVPNYGNEIELYLNDFLSDYGRSALFTHVENSSLLGAAIGTLAK